MGQPQSLKTGPNNGTWSYLRPMEFKVETPKTQTMPRTPATVELTVNPKVQTTPNSTGTVETKVTPKLATTSRVSTESASQQDRQDRR